MNYFIEGIQGSGKTTMLEKMTQDNPKLKAYREGDFSPVELAWCAYVSHSQYEIIIKKYANLAGEIKKNTVKEGEMYIITYTRIITDIPDFHKELEQYEIYNGLKSKAEFEEIVLSRFTSWSEDNQLFECSIFQNIIENQILYLQMNDDEIVDFYTRVKDTLKGKKYKIIYADPPWRYERSKVQGAAEKHYPTMQLDELCALPVSELADQDCILFLWATFPQLNEALELIKAWGFTYKSVAFVWLKLNRKSRTWFYGLGFWTRGNAEICLLATKGHPKRKSAAVHQFIISPIEQHSKKPDEAREKIIALMGDLPRIELFARQRTPGWDVWGNEVEHIDIFS